MRPKFEDIQSGEEFNHWYWLKEEMVAICKAAGLPTTGRKFDLRDRIMYALDHDGKRKPEPAKPKTTSRFNWAKAELTPETVLTDNVSFGQNFRRFMKDQIGERFSFNSDFMAWAKANAGKTLQDAVRKWLELEARKKDPAFQSVIADNNMFNQYTRDFLEDNPGTPMKVVREIWLLRRKLPMKEGFVRYDPSDLDLKKSVVGR